MMGLFHSYLAAYLVPDIDPDFMVRAWKWYQEVIATDNRLGGGSFVLLEIMQKGSHLSIFLPLWIWFLTYFHATSESIWIHFFLRSYSLAA
jgi:hypothetical protein